MRLLISGSRGWHDEEAVETVIRHFQWMAKVTERPFVLIHGHARSGADALADKVGKRLGLVAGKDLIRVRARWDLHGKAAGPIRNQQMLDEEHPDVVVAFRATGKSNGTDDMIRRAERAGVTTHVVRERADTLDVTRQA